MDSGLLVPNIGECFDIHRNKWFNDHQMGIFIDRAGCTSHRLKRELLQEWREIRLELPRSWSKVMSVSSPPLVPEQIVTDDVRYYVVWNGKRACEARLDVLGAPYEVGPVYTLSQLSELRPVAEWNERVVGPAHSTHPRAEGWELRGEEIRLDCLEVRHMYLEFIRQTEERPSCETNWKRYLPVNLPWEDIWGMFLRPGIFTPHHYMTFFKALHRGLPTNSRFEGSGRCRLGCGAHESFTHFYKCRKIRPLWKRVVGLLNSLDIGRYWMHPMLVFFCVRNMSGVLKVVNKHARGLIWLAWKFLWQQLAEIGKTGRGSLSVERVIVSSLRMHHTAVLAAIGDYRRVDTLKRAGARKKRSYAQEEAEKFRVFPFITINGNGTFQYTSAYKDALAWAEVKLCPEVS